MVVKYLPVAAPANGVPVFGVFISAPDMNEKFAKSEPVTHDDWVYQQAAAAKNCPNPVRIALDKIRETFRSAFGPRRQGRQWGCLQGSLSGVSCSGQPACPDSQVHGAEAASSWPDRGPWVQGARERHQSVNSPRRLLDLVDGEIVAKYTFAVTGGRPGNAVAVRVAAAL
jgi:hypothetical protein